MSDGKQKRQAEGSSKLRGSQTVDPPIVYHWHSHTPSCNALRSTQIIWPLQKLAESPIYKCDEDGYCPVVSV